MIDCETQIIEAPPDYKGNFYEDGMFVLLVRLP